MYVCVCVCERERGVVVEEAEGRGWKRQWRKGEGGQEYGTGDRIEGGRAGD